MTEDQEAAGDSEENLYDEESREDLLDDDEISAEEEGFMKGYDEAQEKKKPKQEDAEDEF